MAKNAYVVPLVVVTGLAIAGYAAFRLIPRRRTSNGTPASGGSIGGPVGGGTDPYYNQQPQTPGFDLAALLASLFKKGSPSSPLGASPGGGLGAGSPKTGLSAYNVLFDAQHGLNLDGTPISYGQYASTDALATSGPLASEINAGYFAPVDATSAPSSFTDWWNSFTGFPLDTSSSSSAPPGQSVSDYASTDSLAASFDPNSYFDIGSTQDSLSAYGGGQDYYSQPDYSQADYSGYGAGSAGNYDSGSYDYSSMDGGGW